MDTGKILILTGNANPALAQKVALELKKPLTKADVIKFSDGEIFAQILDDVRGGDVFLIQPTCAPPNQNLMELLIMLDALKRASAIRVTAVLPYFGYARQDRKDRPRVPITAKLVANLITAAGADRVLTLDLHAHQIQGFFDIPLDHIYGVNVFIDHFKKQGLKNPVIATPDVGGIKMARGFAERMGADLAVVDKRRVNDRKTEVMNILGEVKDRDVVLVDDIVATAGSITEAAGALKSGGAKRVFAAATHGVLSGPAIERIESSPIEKVWVTDSIPLNGKRKHAKIEVVSIASLLAEAIKRIHREESISSLFQ